MSTGAVIFLVIFLIIVGVLVTVGIFGSKKNRREKAKLLNEQKNIEEVAKNEHIELYILLDVLIKTVNQEIKDIGNSNKSIAEINIWASDILELIKNSNEIKNIFKSLDRKKEFLPIIGILLQTKPNKWEEEAYFSINLVRSKVKALELQDEYKDRISQARIKYEKFKPA